MSPAKRKVVARKPRGGAKARKPAGKSAAQRSAPKARCDVPMARLAALVDRDDGSAELLAHVPGCPSCTTALTVIAATSRGLKSLVAQASGGGTVVERVIARGGQVGRERLADLVYELAKACLVVVQDIDRRLHLEQRPRGSEAIERDVQGVAARLPKREREAVNGLPRGKPSEERALGAAESCLRILERLEGASERQRLGRSVWLICSGRPAEAEGELLGDLSKSVYRRDRLHAFHNILWAQVRQEKFELVLGWGKRALAEYPNDWITIYNLVAASARCGQRQSFSKFAKLLSTTASKQQSAIGLKSQLLGFEIPRMAEDLDLPTSEIRRILRCGAAGAEACA